MSDRSSGGLHPRKPGRRTLLKARARPRKEVTSKQGSPPSNVTDGGGGEPGPSTSGGTICDIAERPTSSASSSLEAKTEPEPEPDDETSDLEEGSTTASEEEEPIQSGDDKSAHFDPAIPGPSGLQPAVIKPEDPHVDPKLREQELLGARLGEELTPEQKTDLLITNCKSLGDNQHECCMCKKKIRGGLTHLRMHMRTHTGHRPYKCDQCGAQFVQRAQLRAHSICHSELRPFACQICGKRFKRAESVKDHMKVHTGEKPFKCSYCDRWFGHKCDVVKHERVHTGEKPYSCQHCGRAFSQKGALRVHIRTHTKERPYECPHKNCDKAFPILSSLQRHLCKHSGTKPFACDLCPVSFFTQTHLKRHRRTHFELSVESPDQQEIAADLSLQAGDTPPPRRPAADLSLQAGDTPPPRRPLSSPVAAPVGTPLFPPGLVPAPPPTQPELKCEKCQQTFVHYARWQRHVAICTLAEEEAEQVAQVPQAKLVTPPEVLVPSAILGIAAVPVPAPAGAVSLLQPTITSVFHPKKFRRPPHPPPLMKFRSKQGDEIEVGLVQRSTVPPPAEGAVDVLAAPEVTIEPRGAVQGAVGENPKLPTQGVLVNEPGPPSESSDFPGPSGATSSVIVGEEDSPETGTVVFLNREVTIRKLPSSKN